MDEGLNPYAPGAGMRPPAMVGRDAQLSEMQVAVKRTANHLVTRSPCLWGLRGVGKTVLLNAMRDIAESAGWLTAGLEAAPTKAGQDPVQKRFARDLVASARSKRLQHGHPIKDALGSIASFSLTVGVPSITVGVNPTKGRADTGNIEEDIAELVADVSAALTKRGLGFAIFVDEMQDLDQEFIAALLTTQHKANQRGWPFFVIGAGLPNLLGYLSKVRTYAERLFTYHEIGALTPAAAADCLIRPADERGVAFRTSAVKTLVDAANGYPYFLQEFGRAIWDLAPHSPFTKQDALAAVKLGIRELDSGFFPARWERATPLERAYLAAMAVDGDTGSSSGAIADRLTKTAQQIGPTRAQLIGKGLIYAPEHGIVRFSVPGMAAFIARQDTESWSPVPDGEA